MNKKMLKALNTQINKEMYSAYLYLGMAGYFESNNLKGFASWMKVQAQEEMIHAMKIYDYIVDRGDKIQLLTIDAPVCNCKSPLDVFEAAYKHEQKVTKMIHDLVDLADEVNDFATKVFLQWFVTEQVEEESSASEIFEKLKMIGDTPAILFLDNELGMRKAD